MDEIILNATISGKGPTLVLLHGYASSQQYFKHVRPHLDKHFTVVTLDLLGFGKSPKPRGDYTYDDHVKAVQQTLEKLRVARPYVMLGHSMGALIALRYATENPQAISHLLLFNPPLFTSAEQLKTVHKSTGALYRALLYSPYKRVYWRLLKLLPRAASRKRYPMNMTDILRMSRDARENSYINVISKSTIFEDLDKITIPVLLVNGRYDRAIYQQNLTNRTLLSNVTLEIVETGHHTLVQKVKMSERLICSFTSGIMG